MTDILALLQPIQNSVSKTTLRQLSRIIVAMIAMTGRVTLGVNVDMGVVVCPKVVGDKVHAKTETIKSKNRMMLREPKGFFIDVIEYNHLDIYQMKI